MQQKANVGAPPPSPFLGWGHLLGLWRDWTLVKKVALTNIQSLHN